MGPSPSLEEAECRVIQETPSLCILPFFLSVPVYHVPLIPNPGGVKGGGGRGSTCMYSLVITTPAFSFLVCILCIYPRARRGLYPRDMEGIEFWGYYRRGAYRLFFGELCAGFSNRHVAFRISGFRIPTHRHPSSNMRVLLRDSGGGKGCVAPQRGRKGRGGEERAESADGLSGGVDGDGNGDGNWNGDGIGVGWSCECERSDMENSRLVK